MRHRFRFSPTYALPGIKSPGQMLQGWQVRAIWAWQSGFAWGPDDATTDDGGGGRKRRSHHSKSEQRRVAELELQRSDLRLQQCWRHSHSLLRAANRLHAVGFGARIDLASLFRSGSGPLREWHNYCAWLCHTRIALRGCSCSVTRANGACYMQKGGILTPPRLRNSGDAARNLFHGPPFQDVDFALEKLWHVKSDIPRSCGSRFTTSLTT